MKIGFASAVLGVCALTRVGAAAAQGRSAIGISAEATNPSGPWGQAFNANFGAELFAKKQFQDYGITGRLGLAYRPFTASSSWHMSLTSLEGSAEHAFRGLPFSPILLGGLGVYSAAEKATVAGGTNGIFHDPMDRRSESLGGVIGGGFDIGAGSVKIPLRITYHRVPGIHVQGDPLAFTSFSLGIQF